jgi:hypothetical protein
LEEQWIVALSANAAYWSKMTVSIRQVTMPPGVRIVVVDHYPTLRMVMAGRLEWSVTPALGMLP